MDNNERDATSVAVRKNCICFIYRLCKKIKPRFSTRITMLYNQIIQCIMIVSTWHREEEEEKC